MKIKNTCLLVGASMLLTAGCAMADGNAFTPLNFDDTAYNVPSSSATTTTGNVTTNTQNTANATTTQTIGHQNLQSSVSQLDTALDAIKNEQTTCKAKYAEIDNQYKFVKNERSNMKKVVRKNDKRIKELSKAKDKINKYLQ